MQSTDSQIVVQIQRALDLLEDRLRETLRVDDLARHAGYSSWHFQRLFAAVVGEPIASYLRRRRLTAAAVELRNSSRRILDVALDYQFESHEAFTRAFKATFHINPGEFRRNKQLHWTATRPRLTPDRLQHLIRIAMKPTIIELPALTLIGFEARFISALSPDANNFKIIPPLWQKLWQRCSEITHRLDQTSYGACRCLSAEERSRDDELIYLAGFPVSPDAPVPNGMTRWTIPALTYAKFTHRGPIMRLKETINAAHAAWLPRSDYTYANGPELEHYDERFGDGGEGSELDFLLPVRPKK